MIHLRFPVFGSVVAAVVAYFVANSVSGDSGDLALMVNSLPLSVS